MTEFRFAEMNWLHATWGVLLIAALLVIFDLRGRKLLDRMLSPGMQQRLVQQTSITRRLTSILLLTIALLLLVVALMRPQWGKTVQRLARIDSQIMVCLDVSKSMLAEDVVPNRLERAKAEIDSLLSLMDDGQQVGLIAFAGKATVLCPMTTDFGFLRLILAEAAPSTVGMGGTRVGEAIEKAVEGFRSTGDVNRMILLITDGEDHDSFPLDAAEKARERGVKIVSVGFGDEAGSKIEVTDPVTGARSFLKDRNGQDVVSRLDGQTLREIALKTEGAYIPAGTGALDLQSIYDAHIKTLLSGSDAEETRVLRNEGYQWFVLMSAGFFLASLLVRQSFAAGRQERVVSTKRDSKRSEIGSSQSSVRSPNETLSSDGQVSTASDSSVASRVAMVWLAILMVGGPSDSVAMAQSPLKSLSGSTGGAGEAADSSPNPATAIDSDLTSRTEEPEGSNAEVAGEASGEEAIGEETSAGETSAGETNGDASAGMVELEQPPRVLYNRAVRLISTDPDRAERLLTAARNEAGADGELRYRSLYNLGWVEVNRADALVESEPEQALKHLELSAGRFSEAVRIRPDSQEARRNLEVISQRILELRDRLAQKSQTSIEAELDAMIQAEREHQSELQSILVSIPRTGDLSEFRSAFRKLGVTQRRVISDGEKLADTIRAELETIQRRLKEQTEGAEQESSIEDQVRAAQLGAALPLLERSIQRLQKSRSFTRRSQIAAAFARWASGLSDTKRARDQLRNPIEILGVLIPDSMEVARNTQGLLAKEKDSTDDAGSEDADTITRDVGSDSLGGAAPAWLTLEFVQDSQDAITERTQELRQMLERIAAGGEGDSQADQDSAESLDASGKATNATAKAASKDLMESITSALPLLVGAVDHFEQADRGLHEGNLQAASDEQAQAIEQLMAAAEYFYDLRRMIEVMHRDQQMVQNLLTGLDQLSSMSSSEPSSISGVSATDPQKLWRQLLPSLAESQLKNLQRGKRLRALLEAERARVSQTAAPNGDQGTGDQDIGDQDIGDQASKDLAGEAEIVEAEMQRLELAEEWMNKAMDSMQAAVARFDELDTPGTEDLGGDPVRRPPSPKTTRPGNGENKEPEGVALPLVAVAEAAEAIEELRRLFFSIVEHLRDTAQRQAQLNDETTRTLGTRSLGTQHSGEQTTSAAAESSEYANRQAELESTAAQIAEALREQGQQAQQSGDATAGLSLPGGPQGGAVPNAAAPNAGAPNAGAPNAAAPNAAAPNAAAQNAETLLKASELVADGKTAMNRAKQSILNLAKELQEIHEAETPGIKSRENVQGEAVSSEAVPSGMELAAQDPGTAQLEDPNASVWDESLSEEMSRISESQAAALAKLVEALQLLDSQQSQPNQDQSSSSNEQQESEPENDSGNNQDQSGEQGDASEQQESSGQRNMNAEQMLQAIRDREAKRRQNKASRQAASQTTVEKDW